MSATWRYLFHDLMTGVELATLPLTGVTYNTPLSSLGSLRGQLTLLDPQLRARDPWALTEPRRTAVFVEHGQDIEWGGVLWGRSGSDASPSMAITAVSFESLLMHHLLTLDHVYNGMTAAELIGQVLAEAQVGYAAAAKMTVEQVGPAVKRDVTWLRNDLKTGLEIVQGLVDSPDPVTFRSVFARRTDGTIARTLQVGEPGLGAAVVSSDLVFTYPGDLLTWSDDEEGAVVDNVFVATTTKPAVPEVKIDTNNDGTPDTVTDLAEPEQTLFAVITVDDLGSDELAAGFPRMMHGQSVTLDVTQPLVLVPGSNPATYTPADRLVAMAQRPAFHTAQWQAALVEAVTALALTRRESGRSITGVKVRADGRRKLGTYYTGDEVQLAIAHPYYREWPNAVTHTVRITDKAVTVGDASTPTSVNLSVTAPDGMRVPPGLTLTAEFVDILKRLKTLETR